MGHSRWDSDAYATYSSSIRDSNREEIFSSRINPEMDPKSISFREARDSDNHPNSTPIIVGLDVTGSMGMIAEQIAKEGLGTLVNEILQRRPVPDPALCFMAIGDAYCDQAPLQVGQFESDIVMAEWLSKMWLEGGGGGNNCESYDLPYYFALYHTRTDAKEKRDRPGIIITIGDEEPNAVTRASDVSRFVGSSLQEDIQFDDLINSVRDMYTPYHIIAAEGSYARRRLEDVKVAWRGYLGNAALVISDHTKIAELIVSMLEVDAGVSIDESISKWQEETQRVLRASFADFLNSGANRLSRRMDVV